jgi:hypothetical protein
MADGVSIFIIHVAAVSWAATQVPEIKAAIHSCRNIGLPKAAQVEVLFIACGVEAARRSSLSTPVDNRWCLLTNESLPKFLF